MLVLVELLSVYVGSGGTPRRITVQPDVHTTSLDAQVVTFTAENCGKDRIVEIKFNDRNVLDVDQVLALKYPSNDIPEGDDFVGRITGIKVSVVDHKSQ